MAITLMVYMTAARDTMTIMLLQENKSIRVVECQTRRAGCGHAPWDEVPVTAAAREALERDDADDSITIGCSVSVVDVDTDEKLEYVIGSAHGVLSRGTVSALSPIGRALLGRRVGERVSIQLPDGRRRKFALRQIGHPREP